jgi:hypothetical protein
VEDEPAAVSREQLPHVHDLRLEGVEAIEPDADEIVEELVHVAAGMDEDVLARLPHRPVHPPQGRVDELFPYDWAHDESMLLAPIVAEIDRVDVVATGLEGLLDIVVGYRLEERVGELGGVVEVHEQIFHAPHRPGPLEKGKADVKDPEPVGRSRDLLLGSGEKSGIPGIGKHISGEIRAGKGVRFDYPDILVHLAVPDRAEHVLEPIVSERLEEADVVPQTQEMVVQGFLDMLRPETGDEFVVGFHRKAHVPGHIRWRLPLAEGLDNLAFGHSASDLLI